MSTHQRLSVIGIAAMVLLALVIAQGQGWMVDRDFFTYWGGGRGLLDGVNLYDRLAWSKITFEYGSTWFPNPVFIYAPPTAIFFAPLAALSIQASSVLWTGFSELFVAAVVIMIAKDFDWPRLKSYAPFWAIGFLFFMPVLLTLLMGQVSALILLVVAGASMLWDRGKWLEGGLLIGVAVVKPQPVLLLLPLMGLWLIAHQRWSGLIGMVFSLGASVFASFLLFPTFVSDWQAAAITKVGGVAARMPTVWGLGAELFGDSSAGFRSAVLFALILVIASLAVILQWKDADALTISSILLIPSLLVTPYLWSYDQILLIMPLLVALIRMDQDHHSFWQIALLPLGVDLAAFGLFLVAAVRLQETMTILLPVLVGVLLWYAFRQSRWVAKPAIY